MGAIVQRLLFKNNADAPSKKEITTLANIDIEDIDGVKMKMSDLLGTSKVSIVVNVASKWAFAHKSYVELVNVFNEY